VASCFVLITDGDRAPIGYYTLAAAGILLAELPGALAKRLPRSDGARDFDETPGGRCSSSAARSW
jgi:hypothetical protein